MKAVIQRVKHSSVTVDGKLISKIDNGFMILLGVMDGDTKEDADKLIKKIPVLRIFEDENGKMNLSLVWRNSSCISVYPLRRLLTRKAAEFYKIRTA